MTLRATTSCNAAHAVCTAANGRLLQGVSATVSPSLPALSVFDAEVQEGSGARLDFEVRLSRAAEVRVGVYYETADGTARAGRYPDGSISYRARRDCEAGRYNDDNGDYLPASGLLLFEAGETVKTVSVAVCDDAHDEGSETMYLRLTGLALVEGLDVSSYIADGEAVGTITNDDPMPGAWLARFGRTVGSQVLEAVSARVDGRPNSHLRVGGVTVGGVSPLDATAPLTPRDRLAAHLAQGPDARRPEGARPERARVAARQLVPPRVAGGSGQRPGVLGLGPGEHRRLPGRGGRPDDGRRRDHRACWASTPSGSSCWPGLCWRTARATAATT